MSFSSEARTAAPPILPPKTGSHETSRVGTPAHQAGETYDLRGAAASSAQQGMFAPPSPSPSVPDPGETWLPLTLEHTSKQDVAAILSSPSLLQSLTHSPETVHPSLSASHKHLQDSLAANVALAAHLSQQAARLSHLRSDTQAQLLATHTLERQWRQKELDMDHALSQFSPASLYQRLGMGLGEQEGVCRALEESFLDEEGDEGEREVVDWVRRYREARTLYYLREERKKRWDEGRVGGWR